MTGYQGFSGREVNGSTTVVRALMGRQLGDWEVEGVVLPVVWDKVDSFVRGLDFGAYDAAVFFGEGQESLQGPVVEVKAWNKARAARVGKKW